MAAGASPGFTPWSSFRGLSGGRPHPPELRRPVKPIEALLLVMLVSVMVASGTLLLSRAIATFTESTRTSSGQSRGLVDVVTELNYGDLEAAGTGIVLGPSGWILTNNHVISGGTSIWVRDVSSGRVYPASVMGYDAADDVALLRAVGASRLEPASFGSSSALAVGNAVVAVGNAGGIGGSPVATRGIVTGLDQTITAQDELNGTSETLTGLIETNAYIFSGDSGGALLTATGRVVGMLTAGSSGFRLNPTGGAGFAIPINRVMAIAAEIESGRASGPVHIGSELSLSARYGSSL